MNENIGLVEIPVNTRTIGTPGGVYILYLEDYVHTFIKKLLSQNIKKSNTYKITDDMTFYGKRIEEEGTSILIVSGVASVDFMADKAEKFFKDCEFIGMARANVNKNSGIRLEISFKNNVKVILDDFYIYYDQNEQMQNYLIEWNLKHQTPFLQNLCIDETIQEIPEPVNTQKHIVKQCDTVTKKSANEEPKVSFMWNALNVLSLGFVICVMVYGIVSINNYHKMHSMEETINYCVSVISDNLLHSESKNHEIEMAERKTQEDTSDMNMSSTLNPNPDISLIADNTQNVQPAYSDSVENITHKNEKADEIEIQENNSGTESLQESIPQYYVVRRGDTLRTICFDVYGDYSRVSEVCRLNNIDNPDNILYGQKLLLP